MKNSVSLLAVLAICVIIFSACQKEKVKENIVLNSGSIKILNNKGGNDSIAYECVGCAENIKDTAVFNSIIVNIVTKTKNSLKFPLSFLPIKLNLTVSPNDSSYYYDTNQKIENLLSLSYSFKYIAKNAVGNELEQESKDLFYIKDLST